MAAITLVQNPDGSIGPAVIGTPGPRPILDGVVVRSPIQLEEMMSAQEKWDKTYWNGGTEQHEEDQES